MSILKEQRASWAQKSTEKHRVDEQKHSRLHHIALDLDDV